jgi:hypothetical protein
MELAIQIQVEELPEGVFLATSEQLSGLLAQADTLAETLDGDKQSQGFRFHYSPSALSLGQLRELALPG